MTAYRITRGDTQARLDSLGRLTHLGHPDRIKERPTPFHLHGPHREGHWAVNCGNDDIVFDPETTQRTFDYEHGTLTLDSPFRGPGEWFGLNLKRTLRLEHGLLRCDFILENWSPRSLDTDAADATDGLVVAAAHIRRLRYTTGINCWTDYSSDWHHRPYPTAARTEQNFLWLGAQAIAGEVVGLFTATRADGWHVNYERTGDQRIASLSIDFINSLDAHPARITPQDVRLGRGNPRYSGTFYIGVFDSLEALWQKAAEVLGVAFARPRRCSGFIGETLQLDVIAPQGQTVKARVRDEVSGAAVTEIKCSNGRLALPLHGEIGRTIVELDAGGMTTEARVWRHDGWARTLAVAGRYAADLKPASGFNAESMLGLITLAQVGAMLGDNHCRVAAERIIDHALTTHFDADGQHHQHHRLQNYGSFLDAIRIYQRCFKSDVYLDAGRRAATQLMSLQRSDGNFYRHHSIYNNVIHPVKSLADWGEHLRTLGHADDAKRINAAVERAYRNIARSGDDTQTEGADHYEDGMTACCGYQIASLWQRFGRKAEDLATAELIYRRRGMLKNRVPDSRLFGGTMRHWELYWALGLGQGMLCGHGWGAWSASLAHALFMATGRWDYLMDAYATVTNCLQSVDLVTGQFAQGFVYDANWRNFYGLGTQHPGETYIPLPDEIRVSCEQHSVFLTLDDSFYRQTYIRVTPAGSEVFNGRVLTQNEGTLDIESFALAPEEVVVAVEPGATAPHVTIKGTAVRTVTIAVAAR